VSQLPQVSILIALDRTRGHALTIQLIEPGKPERTISYAEACDRILMDPEGWAYRGSKRRVKVIERVERVLRDRHMPSRPLSAWQSRDWETERHIDWKDGRAVLQPYAPGTDLCTSY
jgi:hypothetical protein